MADVVIPYLNIRNAFAALELYKVAFGAEVLNIIERKEMACWPMQMYLLKGYGSCYEKNILNIILKALNH